MSMTFKLNNANINVYTHTHTHVTQILKQFSDILNSTNIIFSTSADLIVLNNQATLSSGNISLSNYK